MDALTLPFETGLPLTLRTPPPTYVSTVTSNPLTPSSAAIRDFGEKIGGARKDTAERGYSMTGKKEEEGDEPAWRKKYVAMQKLDGSGWTIGKKGDTFGIVSARDKQTFATQEEAEAVIPLMAVAEKHRVHQNADKTFSIYKRVSDRKIFKVVGQDFSSHDEAMKYMATHAEEILNIKTTFGEEILPVPEIAIRKGVDRRTGPATPEMFMETFAPRGIEFGNWQNQEERQQVLDHAYDGLLDLADVLGVPPKALMLNGDLAIAFGARGQGLTGARAHYERDYGIINLTKMKGAGSLSHEWMHAFDHYLARVDTKATSEKTVNKRGDPVYKESSKRYDFQSHGPSRNSQLREEVRNAYDDLIKKMFKRDEQYVEDSQNAEKFIGKAREELSSQLNKVRQYLAADYTQYSYLKKHGKPALTEQLAEFDRLADFLVEGNDLQTTFRFNQENRPRDGAKPKGMSRSQFGKAMAGRHTNDTLEAINAIMKAVRNRQGFNSEHGGYLDSVRAAMSLYDARIKMLDDAKAGTEKTRKVTTNFAIEAKKMDQARTGDYWGEPEEMVARAFAAYCEDRIAEKGCQSDFLVYHAHGGIFLPMIDGFVARPYPEGKEREVLNQAFDIFLKTFNQKKQTRE
ncbi:MAG: LPD1 domain-containing protein [Dissulfurispiraceae bacterium]